MSHPDNLSLALYADSAAPAEELAHLEQHIGSCALCSGKVERLQADTQLIRSALLSEPKTQSDEQNTASVIPKFKRPAGLREFALANLVTALIIWLAGFLWKTMFGELVVNGMAWATSIFAPDAYGLASAALLNYIEQGTTMLDAYMGLIIVGVVALTATALALRYIRARNDINMVFCALMAPFVVMSVSYSESAAALETRKGTDVVTVAEGETVNDTLLMGGDTILVKGKVTGDLFAAGQRVEIDGVVEGNLIAFAETVEIRGSVAGTVVSAASSVDVESAALGGDLWAAGENLSIDNASTVKRNVTMAGNRLVIAGSVGKGLTTASEIVEFSGTLGEDLNAFGAEVRLLNGAKISGDARLRVENEESLQQEAGAVVDGELVFLDLPKGQEPSNRYLSVKFYLWQLARILSAVLVGLALIWLVPGFQTLAVEGGMEGLKAGLVGFLSLFAIPLAAGLVAFTLIGIPLSVVAMMGWIILMYLGKIVVGLFIGRSILDRTDHETNTALALLLGITIVIVVVNLPWLGGLLGFVFTVLGAGLIVQRLYESYSMREA